MRHSAVTLVHSLLAVVPVCLVSLWPLTSNRAFAESYGYNCGLVILAIAAVIVGSWFPLLILIATRRASLAPGDRPRVRKPLHPVGWITGFGVLSLLLTWFGTAKCGHDAMSTYILSVVGITYAISLWLSSRYASSPNG